MAAMEIDREEVERIIQALELERAMPGWEVTPLREYGDVRLRLCFAVLALLTERDRLRAESQAAFDGACQLTAEKMLLEEEVTKCLDENARLRAALERIDRIGVSSKCICAGVAREALEQQGGK